MVSGKSKIVNQNQNKMKTNTLTHTKLQGWRQEGLWGWRQTDTYHIKPQFQLSYKSHSSSDSGSRNKSNSNDTPIKTYGTNIYPISHVSTAQYTQIPYLQGKVTCCTISNASITEAPYVNAGRKNCLNIFEVVMKMDTEAQTTLYWYALAIIYEEIGELME